MSAIIEVHGENYLLCPSCGWPFRWDGIASGDECPHCKGYAKSETQLISQQQFHDINERKFFEMRTGGKILLTKFDYLHKYCGGIVTFNLDTATWKCPKCHLNSKLLEMLISVAKKKEETI